MTPPVQCPRCQMVITRAENPSGASPAPHDLMVCYRCGSVLKYDSQMVLRRLKDADLKAMSPDSRTMLLATMAAVNDAKNKN